VQYVHEEKDLGVFLTSDLKSSRQCITSAARARSLLGLISRHFRQLDKDGFYWSTRHTFDSTLNLVYRLGLHVQKGIHCFEAVQRTATKLVTTLCKLSYEQRLDALRLTLYDRRLRSDLTETHKIMYSKKKAPRQQVFLSQWLMVKVKSKCSILICCL